MKQTKHFLRPLLMAIVMLVGMLVPQGAWAQIYLITESDDEIWCESMDVALTIFRQDSWMLGDGPVTMRFDGDNAISEELDCSSFGRDITFDLNGHVLTNEPWAEGWMSCIFAFPSGCRNRITIQNGTIESNELDAIYFQGVNWDYYQKLILKNVNVVTRQEGRHCLFDAGPFDWGNWEYDGNPESSPKLQIIDSEFHSNGCSAISFTLLSNDEYVKSILPEGYSFYNANTDVELAEYADRPFVDENGNPATDIRTGVSQAKIKISNPDGYEDEGYCGNFKQAMDIYGFYGMTLTLLDDVKEGLCTTNSNCMSVTIDLNGHTLDITRLYANGDYLNIIDSSEGKTGRLIVERFDVYGQTENNAVIEGNVKTWGNDMFTNNGLVEYVDGSFINNGDFITSWTWADDHSSATLRINHEDVDAVVTNEDTTPATCIASGVRTYTAKATYEGVEYTGTKEVEISALGHQFGEDHICTVCHQPAEIAHTGTSGTCTWSIYEDGHMIFAPTEGETGTLGEWNWDSSPWFAYRSEIKSVKFQGEVLASSCWYMFYDCSNLTTIDFSGFNTANVRDMAHMFQSCTSLQSLDLSSFNTANLQDMEYMFSGCSALQSVDLSSFNTTNVGRMACMFEMCQNLATLKLSNDFVLNEGVDKENLFGDCATNTGQLLIYYVIDESIKEALQNGTTFGGIFWQAEFVPSAIVKDGVPFNSTNVWGCDVLAEDVVFTRTFTAEKPASAMLPFTVAASQISGATFYEFKGVAYNTEKSEWVATMQDVTTVEAYKPYVVIRDGAGDITFGTGSQTVSFPVTPTASDMTTTDQETGWTFVALNEAKKWQADDEEIGKAYGFAGKNKDYDDYSVAKGEFVKIAAGASAKPGRCYLVKNDGEPLAAKGMTRASAADELPSTIKVRFISGSANGIGTLNTETGEFSIEGWYDLNGNKIEQPSKGGVYINNNKKVMVK